MYIVNKTDGSIAATVDEGTVNTTDTDVALIGKNYLQYGEIVNENFIKLLENFASYNAPTRPLAGQIWYDKVSEQIKVYNGTEFKLSSPIIISDPYPDNPSVGDMLYRPTGKQMFFWNGSEWTLIAPSYDATLGKSGVFVEYVRDTSGNNHIVTSLWNNNSRITIYSTENFLPQAVAGFTEIVEGVNLYDAGIFSGTATDSQLFDGKESNEYFIRNTNVTTSGTISVTDNNGVTIGSSANLKISSSFAAQVISSEINNVGIDFKVKDSGGSTLTALSINGNGSTTFNYPVVSSNTTTLNDTLTVNDVSNFNDSLNSVRIYAGYLQTTGNTDVSRINATGNVIANNYTANNSITVGSTVTATGNISGGNLTTSGVVTASGNITALNFTTGGNVIASSASIVNSISTANIDVTNLVTNTLRSGGITFPIQDGGSGQVLSTNGSGQLGWSSLVKGDRGNTGTLVVGTVTTGAPGSSAIVTNSGSAEAAILNFTIPRGDVGPDGPSYTLPIATDTILGGIKVGTGLSIDGNGVLSASGTGSVNTGANQQIAWYESDGAEVKGLPNAYWDSVSFHVDGRIVAHDSIYSYGDITAFYDSDIRLKEDVKTLDNTLEKVSNLRGVSYTWKQEANKEETGTQLGVIAQEVKEQFPELVHERDNGYLAVDYVKLTAVLLQAVKELKEEVDKLKNK